MNNYRVFVFVLFCFLLEATPYSKESEISEVTKKDSWRIWMKIRIHIHTNDMKQNTLPYIYLTEKNILIVE